MARSRMNWLNDRPAAASMLLRTLSGLLTVSILIQFFIAGMSSITNPEWWDYHKTWVSIFQWLVLPLPILAFNAALMLMVATLLMLGWQKYPQ